MTSKQALALLFASLLGSLVLMTIWAVSPVVLLLDPTLFGIFAPWSSPADFMRQVAKVWLAIGMVIYFAYSRKHCITARLHDEGSTAR